MSIFVAIVHFFLGTLFSILSVRDENFYKDNRIFCAIIFIFCLVNGIFTNSLKSVEEKTKILFIFVGIFSNVTWVLYFILAVSDKIHAFVEGLVSPKSGDYKQDYSRARGLEIENKFLEAITEYEKYISIDPKNYEVYERIARCYYKSNKPIKATKMLQNLYSLLYVDNKYFIKKNISQNEELARLLYLQKTICKKAHISKYKELEVYLKKKFPETKFGLEKDFFVHNYFEVWEDIVCPGKV